MKNVSYEELYTSQGEYLPLRDALEAHYRLNPHFTRWHEYKRSEARRIIKAHDISHLVFGCDTRLLGEMQVQLWAKFAVAPLAWREKLTYFRDEESKVLLKNPVGYRRMLIFFLRNFSEVWRIRKQAQKMSKKWHYFDEDKYFDKSLAAIRAEYGIIV